MEKSTFIENKELVKEMKRSATAKKVCTTNSVIVQLTVKVHVKMHGKQCISGS